MDDQLPLTAQAPQPTSLHMEESEPEGGLWAYHERRFYGLVLHRGNRHMDHVRWFEELGLPDHGPGFDAILRGRMTWDWHARYFVLSFYGQERLSNHVYQEVNRFFNGAGYRVVERPVNEMWQ